MFSRLSSRLCQCPFVICCHLLSFVVISHLEWILPIISAHSAPRFCTLTSQYQHFWLRRRFPGRGMGGRVGRKVRKRHKRQQIYRARRALDKASRAIGPRISNFYTIATPHFRIVGMKMRMRVRRRSFYLIYCTCHPQSADSQVLGLRPEAVNGGR